MSTIVEQLLEDLAQGRTSSAITNMGHVMNIERKPQVPEKDQHAYIHRHVGLGMFVDLLPIGGSVSEGVLGILLYFYLPRLIGIHHAWFYKEIGRAFLMATVLGCVPLAGAFFESVYIRPNACASNMIETVLVMRGLMRDDDVGEDALAFLDNLDSLDAPSPAVSELSSGAAAPASGTPRASTDSSRVPAATSSSTPAPADPPADDEAAKALAFLEEQIKTKRAPLTAPSASRAATPAPATPAPATPDAGRAPAMLAVEVDHAADAPAAPASGGWGGWGSTTSLWSSATSVLQSATKIADEQYKKVRTEGVGSVAGQLEGLNVGGVDLGKLRKGAEERIGGIVKGVGTVDLDKLRHGLLSQAGSTLSTIINTVAPPIGEHETLELWLSHPMVGYGGVEGVVYRAWMHVLEQTESGELVVVWSPPKDAKGDARGIHPVHGWDKGWEDASVEVVALREREEENPQGRGKTGPNMPVTFVPVFLHLQPVLAPLAVPEPPLLLKTSSAAAAPAPSSPPEHLHFIVTLQDPAHALRFVTVSQPAPTGWLEVEYERSDWVEERLVDIIRVAVEVIAQDYVATRMGLKPSAVTRTPSSEATAGDATPEVVEATQAEAAA
ncbi:hypothetical protein Q5752_004059 [Cryptotrichosporon argae]